VSYTTTMGQLLRRAEQRMLRQPKNEKSEYGLLLVSGGLLLFTALVLYDGVSLTVLLAGLALIVLGVAESQPPQRRMVAVALRVVWLLLGLAALAAFLLGLIS
jgi:Flp pilus assembly protein TadB